MNRLTTFACTVAASALFLTATAAQEPETAKELPKATVGQLDTDKGTAVLKDAAGKELSVSTKDGATRIFLVLGDQVGNGSVNDLKAGEQVQYQGKDHAVLYAFVNLVNGSLGKTALPSSTVGLSSSIVRSTGDKLVLRPLSKNSILIDPKKDHVDVFLVNNGTVRAADLKAVEFRDQVQFVEKDGKAAVVFKGKQKKRGAR
jgi:hypothetical protein